MTPNEKHVEILEKVTGCTKDELFARNLPEMLHAEVALTAMQTLQEECDATILSMQNRIDDLEKENLKLWNQLTIGGH